ncbi:hypothetical protein C8J57DRAFT_1634548 [Mycena rebaudengoi]|nr:hypothetical protein C8J57DRAFT_1634548 [Mycena rebaudengoi]
MYKNMQFKPAIVVLAVMFAGATNASAIAPDSDVAIAHVLIHPILDPSLCFTPSGFQVILAACASPAPASQIWGVGSVDGPRNVQFQNAADNLCFEMDLEPSVGQLVLLARCTGDTGGPISNTEFDTTPQTITAANLPMVVTSLQNRIHFRDSGFCVERSGGALVFNHCNGGIGQTFLLTAVQ